MLCNAKYIAEQCLWAVLDADRPRDRPRRYLCVVTIDDHWEEARELFLDLAELPAEERARALEELAARDPALASRVRDLLRHDREETGPPPPPPARFGPYEVVRPLGRGGMGEVFVARRADGEYEREVAVKVLQAGAASEELVQRFLRERQTLAQLDHEYVADLLDGGTTEDGVPYLVMEYVDGEPADVFAARLPLRERLELFIRIGQAVAHAHERGFVHRDLKPSNILVRPDGTPRLLDFGIARPDETRATTDPASEPLTRTGHRLFTPEYASPEQVHGLVPTARSDVFALGVLLYGFLTDARPWPSSGTLHELERAICEEEPAAPSRRLTGTASRRLSGDLDAIVLQCLEKEPPRRYASVAALCDDLERHLAGEPITARRTGVLVRAARFVRRRPAVPIAAGLLAVALVAAWFAWRADRDVGRSREKLVAAIEGRIATSRRRQAERDLVAARAELDAALAALREIPDVPRLEGTVLTELAVVANLGQEWEQGIAWVERARPLLEEAGDVDAITRARLLNSYAYAVHRTGTEEESERAARAAIAYTRSALPPGHVLRVDALLNLVDEFRARRDYASALAVIADAVEESRDHDPKSEALSRLLNTQAILLASVGRAEEAVEGYREAMELLAWHRGERHPAFLRIRLNLGIALFESGRFDEALVEHERSLEAARREGEAGFVASNLHSLGKVRLARGGDDDLPRAEAAVAEALEIRERLDAGAHTERTRALLALVLARTGRADEVRRTFETTNPSSENRGERVKIWATPPIASVPYWTAPDPLTISTLSKV